MAPSLQGLIEFLLNDIALCGSQGATSSEILKSIETFYHNSLPDTSQRQQTVDRRFKVKVWSWLTHNPEVSVGKDREWNHLSLDEVEQLDSQKFTETNDAAESQHDSTATPAAAVRIFVSNERTWLAVAGHQPDESKLTKAEWGLLSIIASFKSDGVAQTDLVRISGQDKRSVPKRTDALERKGYIAKRAVQVRAARTSLCTLRRFLKTTSGDSTDQQASNATTDSSVIDFEVFNRNLFRILKESRVISRNDLKKALGFDDRWRWRILSRALRKFEQIGVLKRVRAESQYGKLHPCVMLLREPTEKDLYKFYEFTKLGLTQDDDGADPEEDIDMNVIEKQRGAADEDNVVVKKETNVVDAGRIIPSWTPDRILSNQIFDLVDKSGTSGITNMDINRRLFGLFFRRPSESLLRRLVDCWQLSQPLHLRHLAIVRDTAIERTVFYYVHFSASNFAKLVERGEASWEAVEYATKKGKGKPPSAEIPPAVAKAQLDQYGFPTGPPPQGLLNNGNASLFEGIAVCRPSNYLLTGSDPVPVQRPDGSIVIQSRNNKYLLSSPIPLTSSIQLQGDQRQLSFPKAEEDFLAPSVNDIIEMPPEATRAGARTSKHNKKKLRGLPRKERFEAMGMDETWTEYKVLLMDRPTPGVYVTPPGKRRPAGKRQGRPRLSRLAVFKSDKLASLPWFVPEKSDSDQEEADQPENAANTLVPGESSLPPISPAADIDNVQPAAETTQISARGVKRTQAAVNQETSLTPLPGVKQSKSHGGRPSKKPRLEDVSRQSPTIVDSEGALADAEVHEIPKQSESVTRSKSDAVHQLDVELDQEQTPKRRRVGSPERDDVEKPIQMLTGAQNAEEEVPMPITLASETDQTQDLQLPRVPNQKVHPTGDRGGSIGLLRRRLIMEIVEKAGGAYPSGTEIWYPFATALKKTNRKEKPDMRTIKTAIKHLVDAGKLKQLTFSGRDSKGVMITRTIVAKPEMSPNDPLITDMQRQVLAIGRPEPGHTYSPNVEADPGLSRSGGAPTAQNYYLPIAAGATVTLKEKPARIRYREMRRERRLQKALLRQLAETSDVDERTPTGAKRLMTIHRPSTQDPLSNVPTTIARPEVIPRGRPKAPFKLSVVGGTSMLMNQGQWFHAPTGTFCSVGLKVFGRPKNGVPPVESIAEHVAQLSRMAQQTGDPASATNRILRWELQHEDFFDAILDDHPYVDQAVSNEAFQAAPIDGQIRFVDETPVRAPPTPRVPMKTRRQGVRTQPPLQTARPLRALQPAQAVQPVQPAQRRLDRMDTQPLVTTVVKTDEPRQTFRRQRHVQSLPEHLVRKLMVAIVAVRVLAGGAEGKLCDWDLVAAAFPTQNAALVQERAKNVLSRNRLQILKMQRDFQERFLDAYAKNQVPPIDYNHLEQYNWPALIEWANIELDVGPSDRVPSLPATREQFDSIFELREEPVTRADELYNLTTGVSVAYKRKLMTQVPFAVQMDNRQATQPGPRTKELARLDVVKTWVRASVVSPEQSYRAEEAREILSRFPQPLFESAVRSLLTDRVIHMNNRGRPSPGRNYDITDHLLNQINRKRTVDLTMLRSAANFKTNVLDPKLRNDGICDVSYSADDGSFLVMINLAVAGRITLHPRDPPRDKFGLTDGGYLTRQMDKARVRFAIDIRPTASYVYGNPIQDRASSIQPPALAEADDPDLPPRIPFWYDIHGYVVPRIWDMAVATVLGCVATREGLGAETIASMIKPALGAWEIDLLLRWLAEVGAVSREGRDESVGWRVNEWWWLVLT